MKRQLGTTKQSHNQWNNSGALRGSSSDLPDSLVSVFLDNILGILTRIVSKLASVQNTGSIYTTRDFNSPDQVVDGNISSPTVRMTFFQLGQNNP